MHHCVIDASPAQAPAATHSASSSASWPSSVVVVGDVVVVVVVVVAAASVVVVAVAVVSELDVVVVDVCCPSPKPDRAQFNSSLCVTSKNFVPRTHLSNLRMLLQL